MNQRLLGGFLVALMLVTGVLLLASIYIDGQSYEPQAVIVSVSQLAATPEVVALDDLEHSKIADRISAKLAFDLNAPDASRWQELAKDRSTIVLACFDGVYLLNCEERRWELSRFQNTLKYGTSADGFTFAYTSPARSIQYGTPVYFLDV